jgi:hypothetical protein
METVVCERPLVAPRDRLLGAEVVMNMKIAPAKSIQIYISFLFFEKSKNVTYRMPYHRMPTLPKGLRSKTTPVQIGFQSAEQLR